MSRELPRPQGFGTSSGHNPGLSSQASESAPRERLRGQLSGRSAVTTEARPIIKVTDDTTRDELAEYLTNLCAFAKRQQRIVARFDSDEPTAWDKAHRRMDGPLDDWLRAPA